MSSGRVTYRRRVISVRTIATASASAVSRRSERSGACPFSSDQRGRGKDGVSFG
ncbi:hypothetical protein [Amycolatopsis sp. NPDC051071]|uniref:hypothetical protein n=1 Tax=Amycolatopsis sp. NPDC051071 TaxID=3154637 RepID=UPI003432851A